MKQNQNKPNIKKQNKSKSNFTPFLSNKEAIDTLVGIVAIVLIVMLVKWVT